MQKYYYVLALGKSLSIVETEASRPALEAPFGGRYVIMAACLSRDEAMKHVERRCERGGYTYQE